jgi:tetratricopeptide (TPR) repeat protein
LTGKHRHRVEPTKQKSGIAICANPISAQTEAKTDGKENFEGERQWKTLFEEAKRAYNDKRYKEAKGLLVKASAIKPTPKVLANLAQIEIELGEYVSAATHANQALVGLGKNAAVQADLAKANEHIGTVALFFNVEGVEVTVDGTAIGVSPITSPIFVEPGTHKIAATKIGFTSHERSLTITKGEELRVDMQLIASEGAVAKDNPGTLNKPTSDKQKTPDAPFDDSHQVSSNGPNPYILVGGGVVTIGALVTGLVFNAKANDKYDNAATLTADLVSKYGDNGCYSGGGAPKTECSRIVKRLDDGDKSKNIATASFVISGAAAVGTLIYWLWPRSTATGNNVQLNAVLLPGNTWLGVSSRF